MPLNDEQRQAVEYLEGPLLVLAGPGTGKTQLLSAKVAYILEHTDANPENILCLTFTEAGAQNMRDRLQTMIGKAAQDVNIHTYHAFGKNLLDRYQNYAENLERRLESPIDGTAQFKSVAEIQKKLPATDILRNAPTKDIIETIGNAKAARLAASDLTKIAQQNIEDSNAISAEISPILENAPKRAKFDVAVAEVYQPILAVLAQYIAKDPITGNIERLANVLTRDLNLAIEKAGASEKPSVKLLTAWKTKNIEQDDKGNYRLKDYIANKKLLSLAKIMQQYDEKLEKDGLFDFNDMIEWTIHYLKTDQGFRLSLSELFQYVLLDEFQDTNASQFELIKLLTDYEKPCVMAVGDDDQAIYEFQGANASNLMDFREHYQAGVIPLVKNYRCTGEILDLSRKIADQIDDSFAKSYSSVSKRLTAIKDLGREVRSSQISRHEFPCAEAEYYWVSEKIRELIDQGEDPSDIAILAPKHKNLVAILPFLKDRDIAVAYEKRENLLIDEKMQAIINLAKFIHQLASGRQPSSMLPEILSYEFWDLPMLEVMQLFTDRHTKKGTLEILSSVEKFQPLAEFFANLAAKALTAPLELWLNYLIGSAELAGFCSPFLEYYQKRSSDAELLEFYENLATFRQTILAHAKALGIGQADFVPHLSEFVATIEDYESAEAEIMRISNFRGAEKAVQVMTAFKSKGLEFKHVFLVSVDDMAWGKAKGNNNLLALPKNLVQIRHTGISDDEKLRLLFVAMTRAKESLTMTNSEANSDGKHINRLSYLNESSPEDVAQESSFLPVESRAIVIHGNELDNVTKIQALGLSWITRYQNQTPELEHIMRDRVENLRMTASTLTDFINLIYSGPQEVYRRTILHAPDAPPVPQQLYGTLAHLVFEQVTSQGIDDAVALEIFRESARNAALDEDDRCSLLEAGEYNLGIALREFGSILRHPHAKAEVNLSPEHPTLNGVPLTGKIDHLEINPDTKTIEVFDYKTSKFHPEKWNSHPSLYQYRLQLGFYKLLLNLSPTYQKYQVTKGHILFVTPDAEAKVYDKVYEFNDEDEAELKALIEQVYWQITSLNFVKDTEIFLPSNKNYSMKQIREFVEKLLEGHELSVSIKN